MRVIVGCIVVAVALAGAGASAAAAGTARAYDAANATEICGYLPYRAAGSARFETERTVVGKATVGPQTTYPFAWDLARPGFLAVEVAEELIAGRDVAAVRRAHDSALSLGEYMLHAAQNLATPPETPESDDERVVLAAERPQNFHRLYVRSKRAYDAVVAHITEGAEAELSLAAITEDWRPAYRLLAKAQADDKRIELLATDLGADAVAEKEAVACLAHAVAIVAGEPGDGARATARAKASAARWALRPPVNARALPRGARAPFFDYEDAGDALAAAIAGLPDAPADDVGVRGLAKTYAEFVTAAKTLYEARRAAADKAE